MFRLRRLAWAVPLGVTAVILALLAIAASYREVVVKVYVGLEDCRLREDSYSQACWPWLLGTRRKLLSSKIRDTAVSLVTQHLEPGVADEQEWAYAHTVRHQNAMAKRIRDVFFDVESRATHYSRIEVRGHVRFETVTSERVAQFLAELSKVNRRCYEVWVEEMLDESLLRSFAAELESADLPARGSTTGAFDVWWCSHGKALTTWLGLYRPPELAREWVSMCECDGQGAGDADANGDR